MQKQHALFALTLSLLSGAAAAQAASPESLRAECAAKHQPASGTPAAGNEHRFFYYKGQYRGEQQAGQTLPCAEAQYAAYLESQDPVRVMQAYPTAAGRPAAKP